MLGGTLLLKKDFAGAVAANKESVRLDPDNAAYRRYLAFALASAGDTDAAVTAYREAIRLEPKVTASHYNLGTLLLTNDDLPGAAAAFQEAIRLEPKLVPAHNNLGLALRGTGDLDGAAAAHREAIRLEPKNSAAHNNLGLVLQDRGDLYGAAAAHREAIRLNPKLANAHNNLGRALLGIGDLDGALACFRTALELEPGRELFRTNVQQVERWRELLPRLADVAAGRAGPTTPAEALAFAGLCAQPFQKRYALAARLSAEAFAADPALAAEYRYNAACNAALAAAGRDAGTATFGVEEWGHLTEAARGWLRADLVAWAARATDPKAWPLVRSKLTHWKRDTDLIAVRDPAWLAAMPGPDRDAWAALWADVDALLAEVTPAAGPPPARQSVVMPGR
jgi:Flp pilus assembly protein TadD